MRRLAGALAVVIVLGAGFWFFTNTGSCPAARLDGTLVESPSGELALRVDGSDAIYAIEWQLGFGVRRLDDGRLAVAGWQGFGPTVAAAGDHVGLPGGEAVEAEQTWAVCALGRDMDELRL